MKGTGFVQRVRAAAPECFILLALVAPALSADGGAGLAQDLSGAGREAWAAMVYTEAGVATDRAGTAPSAVWVRPDEPSSPVSEPPVAGSPELWSLSGRVMTGAGVADWHIAPGYGVGSRAEPVPRLFKARRWFARVLGPLTPTRFLRPGRTLLYCYRPYCPWEGTVCLDPQGRSPAPFTDTPSEARPVETEEDLVGEVSIGSAEDAVSYLRIFTTPALVAFDVGKGSWSEIRPDADISEALAFGMDPKLTWRMPSQEEAARQNGLFGLVLERTWSSAHLWRPAVAAVPDGYLVVRWLCWIPNTWPVGSTKAYRVAEAVSRDGVVHREILEERDLGPEVSFVYAVFSDLGTDY